MVEKDVEALAAFIKYCEEEALRLAVPVVVIHCLRMASEEFAKSAAARPATVTTIEACTKH
jgi:hypothetical protein